jgi:hypothetical protein
MQRFACKQFYIEPIFNNVGMDQTKSIQNNFGHYIPSVACDRRDFFLITSGLKLVGRDRSGVDSHRKPAINAALKAFCLSARGARLILFRMAGSTGHRPLPDTERSDPIRVKRRRTLCRPPISTSPSAPTFCGRILAWQHAIRPTSMASRRGWRRDAKITTLN